MINFGNNRVLWIVFSKYDNLNGGKKWDTIHMEIKSRVLLILCG